MAFVFFVFLAHPRWWCRVQTQIRCWHGAPTRVPSPALYCIVQPKEPGTKMKQQEESDEDESEFEEDTEITTWLDEVDEPIVDERQDALATLRSQCLLHLGEIHSAITEEIFLALHEVEFLEFDTLTAEKQRLLITSLTIRTYQPNEIILIEEDPNIAQLSCFFVIASCATAKTAEIELVRNNKLLTRLNRGHIFGQRYYLTRQRRTRSATVRVATESPPGTWLLTLSKGELYFVDQCFPSCHTLIIIQIHLH